MGRRAAESAEQRGGVEGARTRKAGRRKADPRPSHETATRTKPSSLCALCASAANLSGATGETRWGHTNSPRYSCVLGRATSPKRLPDSVSRYGAPVRAPEGDLRCPRPDRKSVV